MPAPELLPEQPDITVRQTPGKLRLDSLKSTEYLLVVIPDKAPASVWKAIPEGARLKALGEKRKLSAATVQSRLQNPANTGISLKRLPRTGSGKQCPQAFELLTFAGELARDALRDNPASVAIMAAGFAPDVTEQVLKALLLALAAHQFTLPTFKSKPGDAVRLRTVRIVGCNERIDVERTQIEASANNIARWLTNLPPNKLDAGSYRSALQKLAKDFGWKMEFLDEAKLKRAGAGAFLAVSQGNATRDAGIVHLSYRPARSDKSPHISLVGKGITFDTGGTNLKPFKAMLDMHHDMAGSAVAVATLAALTKLEYPHAVDCWLAITENRISNTAYKSRDIVVAANGTTIEVVHTDAEGRMALADTLALAGKLKPAAIIDFATLTGTCVSAVTERYSGAFSNRDSLWATIIKAGKESGERVWPFPLDADFDDDIKSNVADVLQCATSGGGDHIQAARFLQRFVPDKSNWVHVDLSAATRSGGLAQVPTEVTGFGVRFALSLILDQDDALINGTGS